MIEIGKLATDFSFVALIHDFHIAVVVTTAFEFYAVHLVSPDGVRVVLEKKKIEESIMILE